MYQNQLPYFCRKYPEVKDATERALSTLKTIRGVLSIILTNDFDLGDNCLGRNVCGGNDAKGSQSRKVTSYEVPTIIRHFCPLYSCLQLCRCKSKVGTSRLPFLRISLAMKVMSMRSDSYGIEWNAASAEL